MSLLVELNDVSKIYQTGTSAGSDLAQAMSGSGDRNIVGKVAVDSVTLTLREGDRLGIIGRNGAGKSTLLHMIGGVSDPTSGEIRINGKVTSILTLGVGLREDLSGRENIYVDGEIQGKTRAEVDQVIEQVIEFSELGKFIDYPIRTYSTGMKARLAFSMISHLEPEILIIDEALSVGDASFSTKATARILEICARGKIVILVSHSMQSVRDICNRCIYLKDGRVVLDGTPDEVTNAYINEVRDEDEAALMARFIEHVGNHSISKESAFRNVCLFSGDDKKPAVLVESGKNLQIRVDAVHPKRSQNDVCRVRIIRLDEVPLFDHEFLLNDYRNGDDTVGLEIEFAPLILGTAVYRLDVDLMQRSERECEIFARYSSVFEVYSLSTPAGGKPMLLYPINVSVEQQS